MKQLDKHALEIIRQNQTRTQFHLANLLSSQGYVSKSGQTLNNAHVSEFMIENGMRRGQHHTRRKVTKAPATSFQTTKTESDTLALIKLVASSMPPDKALQVIKAMI